VLLKHLPKAWSECQCQVEPCYQVPLVAQTVLPVAAQDVDAWQAEVMRPTVLKELEQQRRVLVVHLGVDSRATSGSAPAFHMNLLSSRLT
jgi:hypothetical protein